MTKLGYTTFKRHQTKGVFLEGKRGFVLGTLGKKITNNEKIMLLRANVRLFRVRRTE